jgi:hypothetical protein
MMWSSSLPISAPQSTVDEVERVKWQRAHFGAAWDCIAVAVRRLLLTVIPITYPSTAKCVNRSLIPGIHLQSFSDGGVRVKIKLAASNRT